MRLQSTARYTAKWWDPANCILPCGWWMRAWIKVTAGCHKRGASFWPPVREILWTVLVGLQLAAWELYCVCVWTDGRFGTCPHGWRVKTQDQQTVLNFFTAGPLGRKGNPRRLLCLTGFTTVMTFFHQWKVMKPAVTSPFELCVRLWKIPPCLHMPVRWRVLNTYVGFLTYSCQQMLSSVLQFTYCERRSLHALNINSELTQGLKHAYLTDSRVIFHGGLLKSEPKSNAAFNIQQLNWHYSLNWWKLKQNYSSPPWKAQAAEYD